MIAIKKAKAEDLPFLYCLENAAFDRSRQSRKSAIRRSVTSSNQMVFILEKDANPCASATLFIHLYSVRLYSIAVLPESRGKGYGKILMDHIIAYAKEINVSAITLEVEESDTRLLFWYKNYDFEFIKKLPDYYGEGRHALKLQKSLDDRSQKIKNIVVIDKPLSFLEGISHIEIVFAKDYIVNEKFQRLKGVRIFNLCSSYEYQTMGYYVSLLASARQQRIIPNVATIKDFSDTVITQSIAEDFFQQVQSALAKVKDTEFILDVYFGKSLVKKYDTLAKTLYKLFESPLTRFIFKKNGHWSLKEATPINLESVELEQDKLNELAAIYFSQKKFTTIRFKKYKYSLAILIDPNELTPPSCRKALKYFARAAERIGFYTEFITKEDYLRLTEFDALFIRTTTNVNHFTYLFSRYAYAEGLAVIDDPWSILKCANKIYLAETMRQLGIKTPKTMIINKETSYSNIVNELGFPIVLKEPDNAFGLGVFRADNMRSLEEMLNRIFDKSDIVLAQEFTKSSFDWRIGVLDNQPLFACKYHMAENHWQIEKWDSSHTDVVYGKHETLPIEQVPKEILKTALKAAAAMGDGLYGVDLKEINGSAYVIEVNDNPNIDNDIEDKVLKGKLYHKIIYSLYNRLERGSVGRYVSKEYKSPENNEIINAATKA